MALNRFQVLKHKTTHEKELANVWLYYMDNFIDDRSFLDLGDRTRNDFLEAVLPQICKKMFTPKDRFSDLLIIEIPEHRFLHGSFLIGGRMGSLIYFKEIQTGILAVPNRLSEKAEVNYSRFSNPMRGRSPVNINNN